MSDAENWGDWKPEIVDQINISEEEMKEYNSEIEKIKKLKNDVGND